MAVGLQLTIIFVINYVDFSYCGNYKITKKGQMPISFPEPGDIFKSLVLFNLQYKDIPFNIIYNTATNLQD